MKYYKFIGDNEFDPFEKDKVYKGSYKAKGWAKVSSVVFYNSNDWEEVPKPKKSLSEKIEKLKKQAEKEGMKCEVVLDSSISKTASFAFEGTNTDGIEIKLEGIVSDKWISGSATFTATNTKDEWEGVEYAECLKSQVSCFTVGKIYRVNPSGKGVDVCDFLIDNNNYPNGFAGSNRKYLKPSTESAYVEQLKAKVKELYGEIKNGDVFDRPDGVRQGISISCPLDEFDLHYRKNEDTLEIRGFLVYQQGKWATKLHERIEVTWELVSQDEFHFEATNTDLRKHKLEIVELIEKYLNGETS